MNYRKDIQILRGYAVTLVVLFHLGLSNFQSGFLGVDVFFVISGFLMGTIYDGKNVINFLKRRAKRLLPLYFVTIILTLFFSFFLLNHNDLEKVVNQISYSLFAISNIGYWLQNSYFSKIDFNPLLHFWSLGVEFQFYIVFPLLFWFYQKNKIFIYLITALSLLFCFIFLYISPKTSFFMMPLRVWEFNIGVIIAMTIKKELDGSQKTEYFKIILLIILLLIPIVKIDGNSFSVIYGHPGVISLIIATVTGLILKFGLPHNLIESKLGAIFEVIGNYSYAIYLAHFPIIVIFLYKPFKGTILESSSFADLAIIILLIIAFSFILHKGVEKNKKVTATIYNQSLIILVAIIVSSFGSVFISKLTLDENERKIYSAHNDRGEYRCGKIFRLLNPNEISCQLPNELKFSKKEIMLVGNSHADSIKKSFNNIAENKKISVRFFVSNRPLTSNKILPITVLKEAQKHNIKDIFLHYSLNGFPLKNIKKLIKIAGPFDINIHLISPVPIHSKNIPELMYNDLILKKQITKLTAKEYDDQLKKALGDLDKIKAKNFFRHDVKDYFCSSEYCTYMSQEKRPLYFDSNHLTLYGANIMNPIFDKIIDN